MDLNKNHRLNRATPFITSVFQSQKQIFCKFRGVILKLRVTKNNYIVILSNICCYNEKLGKPLAENFNFMSIAYDLVSSITLFNNQ